MGLLDLESCLLCSHLIDLPLLELSHHVHVIPGILFRAVSWRSLPLPRAVRLITRNAANILAIAIHIVVDLPSDWRRRRLIMALIHILRVPLTVLRGMSRLRPQ